METIDSLPDTPLKQATLTKLNNTDELKESIPVLSVEYGTSIMDDLILAACLVTEDTRTLIAFTGSGWNKLETVGHDEEFTYDDNDIIEWLENSKAFIWLKEHGIDSKGRIGLLETNIDTAPTFLKPD